jgi:hypothetical protein
MAWWTWSLIEHDWVPCGYALISREFAERMADLVAEAIEGWLRRAAQREEGGK